MDTRKNNKTSENAYVNLKAISLQKETEQLFKDKDYGVALENSSALITDLIEKARIFGEFIYNFCNQKITKDTHIADNKQVYHEELTTQVIRNVTYLEDTYTQNKTSISKHLLGVTFLEFTIQFIMAHMKIHDKKNEDLYWLFAKYALNLFLINNFMPSNKLLIRFNRMNNVAHAGNTPQDFLETNEDLAPLQTALTKLAINYDNYNNYNYYINSKKKLLTKITYEEAYHENAKALKEEILKNFTKKLEQINQKDINYFLIQLLQLRIILTQNDKGIFETKSDFKTKPEHKFFLQIDFVKVNTDLDRASNQTTHSLNEAPFEFYIRCIKDAFYSLNFNKQDMDCRYIFLKELLVKPMTDATILNSLNQYLTISKGIINHLTNLVDVNKTHDSTSYEQIKLIYLSFWFQLLTEIKKDQEYLKLPGYLQLIIAKQQVTIKDTLSDIYSKMNLDDDPQYSLIFITKLAIEFLDKKNGEVKNLIKHLNHIYQETNSNEKLNNIEKFKGLCIDFNSFYPTTIQAFIDLFIALPNLELIADKLVFKKNDDFIVIPTSNLIQNDLFNFNIFAEQALLNGNKILIKNIKLDATNSEKLNNLCILIDLALITYLSKPLPQKLSELLVENLKAFLLSLSNSGIVGAYKSLLLTLAIKEESFYTLYIPKFFESINIEKICLPMACTVLDNQFKEINDQLYAKEIKYSIITADNSLIELPTPDLTNLYKFTSAGIDKDFEVKLFFPQFANDKKFLLPHHDHTNLPLENIEDEFKNAILSMLKFRNSLLRSTLVVQLLLATNLYSDSSLFVSTDFSLTSTKNGLTPITQYLTNFVKIFPTFSKADQNMYLNALFCIDEQLLNTLIQIFTETQFNSKIHRDIRKKIFSNSEYTEDFVTKNLCGLELVYYSALFYVFKNIIASYSNELDPEIITKIEENLIIINAELEDIYDKKFKFSLSTNIAPRFGSLAAEVFTMINAHKVKYENFKTLCNELATPIKSKKINAKKNEKTEPNKINQINLYIPEIFTTYLEFDYLSLFLANIVNNPIFTIHAKVTGNPKKIFITITDGNNNTCKFDLYNTLIFIQTECLDLNFFLNAFITNIDLLLNDRKELELTQKKLENEEKSKKSAIKIEALNKNKLNLEKNSSVLANCNQLLNAFMLHILEDESPQEVIALIQDTFEKVILYLTKLFTLNINESQKSLESALQLYLRSDIQNNEFITNLRKTAKLSPIIDKILEKKKEEDVNVPLDKNEVPQQLDENIQNNILQLFSQYETLEKSNPYLQENRKKLANEHATIKDNEALAKFVITLSTALNKAIDSKKRHEEKMAELEKLKKEKIEAKNQKKLQKKSEEQKKAEPLPGAQSNLLPVSTAKTQDKKSRGKSKPDKTNVHANSGFAIIEEPKGVITPQLTKNRKKSPGLEERNSEKNEPLPQDKSQKTSITIDKEIRDELGITAALSHIKTHLISPTNQNPLILLSGSTVPKAIKKQLAKNGKQKTPIIETHNDDVDYDFVALITSDLIKPEINALNEGLKNKSKEERNNIISEAMRTNPNLYVYSPHPEPHGMFMHREQNIDLTLRDAEVFKFVEIKGKVIFNGFKENFINENYDFNCRALFMNEDGETFDPTGRGIEDVSNNIINCVTADNVEKNLHSDSSRIIAALRYSTFKNYRPAPLLLKVIQDFDFNQSKNFNLAEDPHAHFKKVFVKYWRSYVYHYEAYLRGNYKGANKITFDQAMMVVKFQEKLVEWKLLDKIYNLAKQRNDEFSGVLAQWKYSLHREFLLDEIHSNKRPANFGMFDSSLQSEGQQTMSVTPRKKSYS